MKRKRTKKKTIPKADPSTSIVKESPRWGNHECTNCNKVFNYRKNLEKHMLACGKKKEKKILPCHKCEATFGSEARLARHQQTHLPHVCTICEKSFSTTTSLNIHLRKHLGTLPYKCTMCDKSYATGYDLRTHRNRHLGIKPYKCVFCAQSFVTAFELKGHVNRHKKIKPYKCGVCSRAFTSSFELSTHMANVHSTTRPHKCSFCAESFKTSSRLNTHLIKHLGLEPYRCNACMKSFRWIKNIKTHVAKCHVEVEDEIYGCSYCTASFKNTHEINEHIRQHPRYKCSSCKVSFKMIQELKAHMKGHGAEFFAERETKTLDTEFLKQESKIGAPLEEPSAAIKLESQKGTEEFLNDNEEELSGTVLKNPPTKPKKKYSCNRCDASFPTPSRLKDHRDRHFGIKGYECTVCNKWFQTNWTLRTHMKIHLRTKSGLGLHRCKLCGKNYTSSSSLQAHTNRHLGIRPHQCTHCDQAFVSSSELRRHATKHLKAKQYNCTECEKSFLNAPALRLHIKKTHSSTPGNEEASFIKPESSEDQAWLEFPYGCMQCFKSFKSYRTIRKHVVQIHGAEGSEDYECNYCHSAFADALVLKAHLQQHLIHKCTKCARSFPTLEVLTRHLEKHAEDGPSEEGIGDDASKELVSLKTKRRRIKKNLLASHESSLTGAIKSETATDTEFLSNSDRKLHLGFDKGETNDEKLADQPRKCDICGKTYLTATALKRHMEYHQQNYKCEHCSATFPIKSRYVDHVNKHLGIKAHHCTICKNSFSSGNSLRIHMKNHLGLLPYQCTFCTVAFASRGSLEDHQNRHLGIKPFKCTNCEQAFVTMREVKIHMKFHLNPVKRRRPTGNLWKCSRCPLTFATTAQLRIHRSVHLKHNCGICGRRFPSASSLSVHTKAQHLAPRPFKCFLCTETFSTSKGQKVHVRVKHMDTAMYKCIRCSGTFKHPESLTRHVEKYEEKDKALCGCNHCEAAFVSSTELDDHLKEHLLYKCGLCESGLATFEDLKNHMAEMHSVGVCESRVVVKAKANKAKAQNAKKLTNRAAKAKTKVAAKRARAVKTEDGPSTCEKCSKTFKNRILFKRHMMYHQENFKCDQCNATFASRYRFDDHVNKHLGIQAYECNICKRKLSTATTLRVHLKKHWGTLPFQCNSCPYAFASRDSLEKHQNRHLGIKPFKCPSCEQAFVTAYEVKIHMKVHSTSGQHRRGHGRLRKPALGAESWATRPLTHKCGTCRKRFALASALSSHIKKTQHLRLKSVKCFLCTEEFKTHREKEAHARSKHLDKDTYKCAECFRSFKQPEGLVRHMYIYNYHAKAGAAMYGCNHCVAAFLDPTALRDHIKAHLLYKCPRCESGCATFDALKDHMESHSVLGKVYSNDGKGNGIPATNDGSSDGAKQEKLLTTKSAKGTHLNQLSAEACALQREQLDFEEKKIQLKLDSDLPEQPVSFDFALNQLSPTHMAESPKIPNEKPEDSKHVAIVDEPSLDSEKQKAVICDSMAGPSLQRPDENELSTPVATPSAPNSSRPNLDTNCTRVLRRTTRKSAASPNLNSPQNTQHGEMQDPTMATQDSKRGYQRGPLLMKKTFECNSCTQVFSLFSALQTHLKQHQRLPHKQAQLKQHQRLPYKCDMCDLSFGTAYQLLTHKNRHLGIKPHKCAECDMAFVTNFELKAHSNNHHNRRPYECGLCDRSFLSSTALKIHGTSKHFDEISSKCPICQEMYTRRDLAEHMSTHKNDQPCKCTACFRTFRRITDIKKHVRWCLQTQKANIFGCNLCDDSFIDANDLSEHISQHLPFNCDICTNRFSTDGERENHMKSHDIRPSMSDEPASPTSNPGIESKGTNKHLRVEASKSVTVELFAASKDLEDCIDIKEDCIEESDPVEHIEEDYIEMSSPIKDIKEDCIEETAPRKDIEEDYIEMPGPIEDIKDYTEETGPSKDIEEDCIKMPGHDDIKEERIQESDPSKDTEEVCIEMPGLIEDIKEACIEEIGPSKDTEEVCIEMPGPIKDIKEYDIEDSVPSQDIEEDHKHCANQDIKEDIEVSASCQEILEYHFEESGTNHDLKEDDIEESGPGEDIEENIEQDYILISDDEDEDDDEMQQSDSFFFIEQQSFISISHFDLVVKQENPPSLPHDETGEQECEMMDMAVDVEKYALQIDDVKTQASPNTFTEDSVHISNAPLNATGELECGENKIANFSVENMSLRILPGALGIDDEKRKINETDDIKHRDMLPTQPEATLEHSKPVEATESPQPILIESENEDDQDLEFLSDIEDTDSQISTANTLEAISLTETVASTVTSSSSERKLPHNCTLCGDSFLTAAKLRNHHNRHVKLLTAPRACALCDEVFPTRLELKAHTQMHLSGRTFKCSACDRTLTNLNDMLQHGSVHGSTQPICPSCGHIYAHVNNLKAHILSQHLSSASPVENILQ